MKKLFLALFLLTAISACFADSRVFTLINPNTDEVLQALQKTYGDKIHADIVRGKLVVVGSKQQLDEIAALLVKIDPAPRALRLTLSEQPPADANSNTITYSTNKSGYTHRYRGRCICCDRLSKNYATADSQRLVDSDQQRTHAIQFTHAASAHRRRPPRARTRQLHDGEKSGAPHLRQHRQSATSAPGFHYCRAPRTPTTPPSAAARNAASSCICGLIKT